MKKYLIYLLFIPIVACTNLIKEEDLVQSDGKTFSYKNNNKLVTGVSRSKTEENIIKRKFENGLITSITYNNLFFPIENGYLNGKVIVANKELFFKNGILQKEINNNKVNYFVFGIPKEFNDSFLKLEAYDFYNFFNIYNNGIVSSSMYKDDKVHINVNFSSNGILKEINIQTNEYTKQYEFIENDINLGHLRSYKYYIDGNLEGLSYEFDGINHILYNYTKGVLNYTKFYNLNINKIMSYDYTKENIISYYEYYLENKQIKTIGYFDSSNNKVGRWIYYYPNGNTKEYREYINNSLAYFNRYYENGIKKVIGTIDIENNIYTGNIKYFSPEGESLYIESYNNYGELVEVSKNISNWKLSHTYLNKKGLLLKSFFYWLIVYNF